MVDNRFDDDDDDDDDDDEKAAETLVHETAYGERIKGCAHGSQSQTEMRRRPRRHVSGNGSCPEGLPISDVI